MSFYEIDDLWKILNTIRGGTEDIPKSLSTLGLSEQKKTISLFSDIIDQQCFQTQDYLRIRNFIIDLYSSHKTLTSAQKNVHDIYSLDEQHLDELFKSFGVEKTGVLTILDSVRGGQKVTDVEPESKYQVLEKYARNLTELARKEKLDPVIGRDDEIRRVMQVLSRRTKNNPVLIGEAGVGKTHLAAAILNAALAQDRAAVFVTIPELMQGLRAAQRTDAADAVLELLSTTDLVVLDDLGSERVTDFVTEQLFVIVNARYLREKQTIVTTNYTQPTALSERYGSVTGERIVSRLREMCRWLVLEGEDWRVAPWTA